MKIFSVLLFLLSFNLQAEELYSSVEDYLKTVTTFSDAELKFINDHPDYQYPNRAVSKNKRWYVGYEPNGTSSSVFLYESFARKEIKLNSQQKHQNPSFPRKRESIFINHLDGSPLSRG